jgi:hypothetical protein
MFNQKEIATIILTSIIIGFIFNDFQTSNMFLYSSLVIFSIIIINSIVKKIAGYYFESEVRVGLWEVKRYGWRAESYFKHAIPAGILFPIFAKIISLGKLTWLALFTFDVEAKVSRAAKRHDIYTFSELSEYHLGVIAAWGIVANLLFAFIAYLLNFPQGIEFIKLSLYYTFFNMLPFSDLDGNKIFFGSMMLWSFLTAIVLLGIFFSFVII